MRNHFFLILVLASLLAFVQKFAEGEISLLPLVDRSPAQTDFRAKVLTVGVEEISPEQSEMN